MIRATYIREKIGFLGLKFGQEPSQWLQTALLSENGRDITILSFRQAPLTAVLKSESYQVVELGKQLFICLKWCCKAITWDDQELEMPPLMPSMA